MLITANYFDFSSVYLYTTSIFLSKINYSFRIPKNNFVICTNIPCISKAVVTNYVNLSNL